MKNNPGLRGFRLGINPVTIPRYYFAARDDQIAPDEAGMEAVVRLARLRTRQGMRSGGPHDGIGARICIDVRDDDGPVLQVIFTFDVHQHRD